MTTTGPYSLQIQDREFWKNLLDAHHILMDLERILIVRNDLYVPPDNELEWLQIKYPHIVIQFYEITIAGLLRQVE